MQRQSTPQKKKCSWFSPHLADDLEFFTLLVIAGQEEAPILTSPFTTAMETTHHHQVQGITDTLQIILLELR